MTPIEKNERSDCINVTYFLHVIDKFPIETKFKTRNIYLLQPYIAFPKLVKLEKFGGKILQRVRKLTAKLVNFFICINITSK